MGVILDSSFIIAAERAGQSVPQILDRILVKFGNIDVGVSVVSIAELVHGAYRAATKAQQLRRLAFIDELCGSVPIHPMTVEIARLVGRIEGQQAARGVQFAFEDLVIGVTALHLGYDLVSLNIRHFQNVPGLRIAGI